MESAEAASSVSGSLSSSELQRSTMNCRTSGVRKGAILTHHKLVNQFYEGTCQTTASNEVSFCGVRSVPWTPSLSSWGRMRAWNVYEEPSQKSVQVPNRRWPLTAILSTPLSPHSNFGPSTSTDIKCNNLSKSWKPGLRLYSK